jgi:NADP+-dependent farnesol dehydrogenase
MLIIIRDAAKNGFRKMDRWANKLAVVTGASVGIGAGIVVELTKAGMIVIGLARRSEKVEALKSEIPENLRNNLHAMKCDVSKEEEIVATFKEIDEKFGGISVLVNNAGVNAKGSLFGRGNVDDIKNVVNVNLYGVVFCTREAYISMKKHNIEDGHIININSINGHYVPMLPRSESANIYPPTKHAVTALTEVYRQDLLKAKSKIRVTSISPALVDTEIREKFDKKERLGTIPMLSSKEVADAVIFALSVPQHVLIQELILRHIEDPY